MSHHHNPLDAAVLDAVFGHVHRMPWEQPARSPRARGARRSQPSTAAATASTGLPVAAGVASALVSV